MASRGLKRARIVAATMFLLGAALLVVRLSLHLWMSVHDIVDRGDFPWMLFLGTLLFLPGAVLLIVLWIANGFILDRVDRSGLPENQIKR